MKIVTAIAAGGAVGAVGRYFVMVAIGRAWGATFPWGTLTANVLGSFILGVLVEVMALVWSVGLETRAFLVVGLLGAFTTFSTFSLDVVTLYERGQLLAAALYVIGSVVLGVAAVFVGLALARIVLS